MFLSFLWGGGTSDFLCVHRGLETTNNSPNSLSAGNGLRLRRHLSFPHFSYTLPLSLYKTTNHSNATPECVCVFIVSLWKAQAWKPQVMKISKFCKLCLHFVFHCLLFLSASPSMWRGSPSSIFLSAVSTSHSSSAFPPLPVLEGGQVFISHV